MSERDESSLPDEARLAQIKRYWRPDNPWYSPSTLKWVVGLLDQARENGDRLARLLDEGMGIVQSLAEDRTLLLSILDEYRALHDADYITRMRRPALGRCECAVCAKVQAIHDRIRQVEQAEAQGSEAKGEEAGEP